LLFCAVLVVCFILAVVRVYLFFFFSSRRRHTRSKRDWSSDVCSSDLRYGRANPRPEKYVTCPRVSSTASPTTSGSGRHLHPVGRSEERRVGKEGGAGGARGHRGKRNKRRERE